MCGHGKTSAYNSFYMYIHPPPPRNVACITGIIKGVEDAHKSKEEVLLMPVAHLGGSADVRGFGAHGLLQVLVVRMEPHVLSGELVVLGLFLRAHAQNQGKHRRAQNEPYKTSSGVPKSDTRVLTTHQRTA